MVRFFILLLIGASAPFSLAAGLWSSTSYGKPITAAFKLSCREDSLKNGTATVELWDHSAFVDDKFVTRMDDLLVDGKTEYTITGDAHNWILPDNYYLKIIHKCHTECAKRGWSYFPFYTSNKETEFVLMNKNGTGDAYRFTSDQKTEVPIDISNGHNFFPNIFEPDMKRCE